MTNQENPRFLSREWLVGLITAFLGNMRTNLREEVATKPSHFNEVDCVSIESPASKIDIT